MYVSVYTTFANICNCLSRLFCWLLQGRNKAVVWTSHAQAVRNSLHASKMVSICFALYYPKALAPKQRDAPRAIRRTPHFSRKHWVLLCWRTFSRLWEFLIDGFGWFINELLRIARFSECTYRLVSFYLLFGSRHRTFERRAFEQLGKVRVGQLSRLLYPDFFNSHGGTIVED